MKAKLINKYVDQEKIEKSRKDYAKAIAATSEFTEEKAYAALGKAIDAVYVSVKEMRRKMSLSMNAKIENNDFELVQAHHIGNVINALLMTVADALDQGKKFSELVQKAEIDKKHEMNNVKPSLAADAFTSDIERYALTAFMDELGIPSTLGRSR